MLCVMCGRVVHENFGILHMDQQKWSVAYDEFFAAFRSYSEVGNAAARRCLKYVGAWKGRAVVGCVCSDPYVVVPGASRR